MLRRAGWVRWLVLAAALVAGTGCTQKDPGPEGKGQPVKPPEPEGTGTLTLKNLSSQVIFRVRLKPEGQEVWGFDRLSQADVIKAGQTRSWEIPAGTYHVSVEFGDGTSFRSPTSYAVSSEGTAECTVHGSKPKLADGRFTVVNGMPWAIASVRFSLNTQMTWGEERLDTNEVIKPGARRTWTVPPGSYNLRIKFQDGTPVSTEEAEVVESGKETKFDISPP